MYSREDLKGDLDVISGYHGWEFFEYQKPNSMMRLRKDKFTMNIYLSTLTIAVIYKQKQCYHRNISFEEIEKVFMHPENYLVSKK